MPPVHPGFGYVFSYVLYILHVEDVGVCSHAHPEVTPKNKQ